MAASGRRLSLASLLLAGGALATVAGAGVPACYSAGSGSAPPPNTFYFPVGLAVSSAGDALYVANSDFDLQWNGGTLQSYKLGQIRSDTAVLIAENLGQSQSIPKNVNTAIPFVFSGGSGCADASIVAPAPWSNGQRPPLGMSCAPPVDSTNPRYQGTNADIGAFASDLQLSQDGTRLFVTVRGDATLTWADLPSSKTANLRCPPSVPANLCFDCNQSQNGNRCDAMHQAGNNPGSNLADSRRATMPGEPFSFAQTENGSAIAVTQQATQETSVLLSGLGIGGQGLLPDGGLTSAPSMQFVLEGVPTGGNGIVAIPHDPDAVRRCEDVNDQFPCVRAAFLETSRSAAEVDLIRYYDDDGSSLHRPFLVREAAFPVTVNAPGTDQRGIVIDPTPRLQCKAKAAAAVVAANQSLPPALRKQVPEEGSREFAQCGRLPARVYIASRSPPTVIFGTIGGLSPTGDGSFDPDQLHLKGNFPVNFGPSRLYLAPIVDASGHYALRLFVVCYDSAQVYVFDPDDVDTFGQGATPETVLSVGPGPFAMAFDPFCAATGATSLVDSSGAQVANPPLDCQYQRYGVFSDVATSQAHAGEASFLVPPDLDPTKALLGLRRYRFGYLATFTNSYLQVFDLDDSVVMPPGVQGSRSQETFESIVFTLGKATPPKGT